MKPNVCKASDCEGVRYCKGYCTKHYQRWMKYGSVDLPYRTPPATYELFWTKVDKTSDPNGCWLWTGSLSDRGYGNFGSQGQHYKAHRLSWSWELQCPLPPPQMLLDHKCHAPACVRPSHLRLVTPSQNAENLKGARRDSKSGIRGVSWSAASGKWVASVRSKGKLYSLGTYTDKREAGEAAKQGRLKYHTHNDLDRK